MVPVMLHDCSDTFLAVIISVEKPFPVASNPHRAVLFIKLTFIIVKFPIVEIRVCIGLHNCYRMYSYLSGRLQEQREFRVIQCC